MLYSHRKSTGMNGRATSCSVTAMAAATMLLRVSHAKKMERSVFSPTRGVNPKKIPMATPPAMAFGVSRIASSFSECSLNHLCRFIGSPDPVQYYQSVRADQPAASLECGMFGHLRAKRAKPEAPEGRMIIAPGQAERRPG